MESCPCRGQGIYLLNVMKDVILAKFDEEDVILILFVSKKHSISIKNEYLHMVIRCPDYCEVW